MKNYILLIVIIFVSFSASLYSQDNSLLERDSIEVLEGPLIIPDSLIIDSIPEVAPVNEEVLEIKERFVPDPTKAVIYSAIFPGLGQIYNRKYWKLPIVYGGFIGCVYAITWNNKTYTDYRNAYRDIMDDDPNTNSWQSYGRNEESLKPILKRRRDNFRRYRDLSCFIAVGLYAVCMIDAYVDAQLFEFDISQDLSMRVDPVLFDRTAQNSRAVGFQCSFTF
ncbi:MAG: DUF5683 domain-containing protein [Bacteroidales bacterium]|nr:DUF5683 domain-containing protein [Bacteroidales bacterium]